MIERHRLGIDAGGMQEIPQLLVSAQTELLKPTEKAWRVGELPEERILIHYPDAALIVPPALAPWSLARADVQW
jgi:hypothetical protein